MWYTLLRSYICSLEELYHKCEFDNVEQMIGYYNNLYFMKIPDTWGKMIMLEYCQEYRDNSSTDILGNRIRFAWNKINQWYVEIRDKKSNEQEKSRIILL